MSTPEPPATGARAWRRRVATGAAVVAATVACAAVAWGAVQLSTADTAPRSRPIPIAMFEAKAHLVLPPTSEDIRARQRRGDGVWIAASFTLDPFDLPALQQASGLPPFEQGTRALSNREDLGLGWRASQAKEFVSTSDHLPGGFTRTVMVNLDNPSVPQVYVLVHS